MKGFIFTKSNWIPSIHNPQFQKSQQIHSPKSCFALNSAFHLFLAQETPSIQAFFKLHVFVALPCFPEHLTEMWAQLRALQGDKGSQPCSTQILATLRYQEGVSPNILHHTNCSLQWKGHSILSMLHFWSQTTKSKDPGRTLNTGFAGLHMN